NLDVNAVRFYRRERIAAQSAGDIHFEIAQHEIGAGGQIEQGVGAEHDRHRAAFPDIFIKQPLLMVRSDLSEYLVLAPHHVAVDPDVLSPFRMCADVEAGGDVISAVADVPIRSRYSFQIDVVAG